MTVAAQGDLGRDGDGRLLGRFTLGRCLGAGTFGVVYEAQEEGRATAVALKKLNELDGGAIYAFKQEFRALSDVVHPNLVTLHELFSVGAELYISMELVDGISLVEYVRGDLRPLDIATLATMEISRTVSSFDGAASTDVDTRATVNTTVSEEPPPMTSRAAVDPSLPPPPAPPSADFDFEGLRATLRQFAAGIFALHCAGKLHRDLKPSNVMVNSQRRVKILDFGLVASLSGSGSQRVGERRAVGTPAYMSPEQALGAALTPASDWYSFGVILFELLTGRLPLNGSVSEILAKKQRLDPPDPRLLAPGIPDDLAELCVALLQRDPSSRPNGPAVLGALGAPVQDMEAHSTLWGEMLPFVGREHHLNALEEAFSVSRSGQAVTVHVHGTSGMGKSALLRRFLDGLSERDGAVVLEGRCYERESVPYKSVDALIDALTMHLRSLPREKASALVPRDVQSLARLFPVLRRVEAVASAPRRAEAPDPKELRRRAFRVLREILGRMAASRPLVICIDDIQWGDADSAALLIDLLEPPEAPSILLILSYRTEDVASIELVRVVRQRLARGELVSDVRELVVGPLAHREARALARVLLAGDPALLRGDAELIAVESGGSPFFVHELTRHVRIHGARVKSGEDAGDAPPVSLQHVLAVRLARLSQTARRLLSIIAVAAGPISYAVASRAAAEAEGGAEPDLQLLAVLRTERLVRTRGPRERIEVEVFHDRIRDSMVAALALQGDSITAAYHLRLAAALEAEGDADPEALFSHFVAAGDTARALAFAEVAADRAESALAFDRAAALYKKALELRGEASQPLRARRAHALANAGRGAEAARAYLDACEGAPPAEALDLRRRAAEQFLRSGHIDDGIAAVQEVLRAVDLSLPKTPARALASLVFRRTQLSLRGLGFTERSASDVSAEELTRIDVCWSVGTGLGGVDLVRGADFQLRHLLYSLRAGEPYRISRAISWEAIMSCLEGDTARGNLLIARASELAQGVVDPNALAWVEGARGSVAFYSYRFRDAAALLDRAITLLRETCHDITWEVGSMQGWWLLPSLFMLGEIDEFCRRASLFLREAQELGALYNETSLRTYMMVRVHLAMDRPVEARREAADAIRAWSQGHGFHTMHFGELLARAYCHLYEGNGAQALEELGQSWPALEKSFLLRAEMPRGEALFARGSSALVAARQTDDPEAMLKAAERDARALEKERRPWHAAFALLLRAGIALRRGKPELSVQLYAAAESAFIGLEMKLHGAAARRRWGEIQGGVTGGAAVREATEWMIGQRIRNPERMTAMVAPL